MRRMQKTDIQHLAKLARIKVGDEEVADLQKDIDAVLEYVSVIDEITATAEMTKKVGPVYNVFRSDEVTCEPGSHTEDLLKEAPERDGNYLKVKKILNTD